MSQEILLNNIVPGETVIIKELRATGSMRRRLLDIGFVENTKIECIGRSPLGDPSAFYVRGAVIALRSEDCADILVQYTTSKEKPYEAPI